MGSYDQREPRACSRAKSFALNGAKIVFIVVFYQPFVPNGTII